MSPSHTTKGTWYRESYESKINALSSFRLLEVPAPVDPPAPCPRIPDPFFIHPVFHPRAFDPLRLNPEKIDERGFHPRRTDAL
jgi:hypothetical protein